MKIIHQDENRLRFKVYPDKIFTIAFLFLIFVCINAFISFDDPTQKIIAGFVTAIAVLHLTLSYIFPIFISIDKAADKLTYRDFTIFPSLVVKDLTPPIYGYNPTTTISVSKLKTIEVTKVWGEIIKPTASNYFYNNNLSISNIGIRFITEDDKAKNIFPGIISYRRHRSACVKIADYLKIPFIDKLN